MTTDNESAAGRRHMETMQALSMKFPTDIRYAGAMNWHVTSANLQPNCCQRMKRSEFSPQSIEKLKIGKLIVDDAQPG